ncbi:hypothetical protein KI387_024965, partial [Taxus chinensis]
LILIMGWEIPADHDQNQNGKQEEEEEKVGEGSVSNKPSIFLAGPPNVGKRAILT